MINYAIHQLRLYGYASLPNFFSLAECQILRQRAYFLVHQNQKEIEENKSIFNTEKQLKTVVKDNYFLNSADRISFFLEDTSSDNISNDTLFDNTSNKTSFNNNPYIKININKIGHSLHDKDEVFRRFCYQQKLKNLSLKIGLKQPQIAQSMYIFKNPYVGGEVSPHCDNQFLMTEPLSIYGYWIALDDATVENGCLWGIPGSHIYPPTHFFRRKESKIGYIGWDEGYDTKKYDLGNSVPIEASEGTLVILDGNFIHYSSKNKSSNPREALTIHIADGEYKWRQDNWLLKEFRKWD